MPAKIEFFIDAEGKDRFRIVGGNGEIVVTSEAYDSKSNAQRGVDDLTAILTSSETIYPD